MERSDRTTRMPEHEGNMAVMRDPTDPIRKKAATYAGVASGTSCNQSSFKAGKGAFLFIGPGAGGRGFKAMFRLEFSLPHARELAASAPDRFQVGSSGWVTARFTADEPLPRSVWQPWLDESYSMTQKQTVKKRLAKGNTGRRQAVQDGAKKSAARTKTR